MTSTADHADLRAQLDALTTEAFRPDLAEIDRRSTLDIARTMNDEDAAVPAAVAARLPEIAAAIDATAARMARRAGAGVDQP
ncbi:N-acetylmuramic acid 6-phosphate etherase, partial [Streptomyces lydicus]